MKPWAWHQIPGGDPTLNRRMKGLESALAARPIRNTLMSDPGLRIDGGSASAVVETQAGFYFVAGGIAGSVAAGTNLPALVGTVANGDFGWFQWSVDFAATVTQATLVTAASLGAMSVPDVPRNAALVGVVLVNPTGTGDFVGGTTNLDDGTVVPGAVFLNGNDFGGI